MTDLCHLPAHQLVQLMSEGAVSCRDVVQSHLDRIDALNPALNALVQAADPQDCLNAADAADERAARGAALGRAHGLPVVVKDVMLGRRARVLRREPGVACSLQPRRDRGGAAS